MRGTFEARRQLILGAAIAMLGAAYAQPANAALFTTTVQQAAGTNWNGLIWNPGGVAPSAGNTYEAIAGGNPTRIRNPDLGGLGGTTVFPGDSLTLDASTELRLKGGANTVINFPGVGGNPGLILNGGLVNTGDDQVFTITGIISVATASSIDFGAPAVAPARAINIGAELRGSGPLSLLSSGPANPPLNITSTNNSFSGGWNVATGFLKGTGLGSLGTGNITVAAGAKFDSDYDINLPASSLTLAGNTSVMVLDQNDTFGAVTINGTSLAPGNYTFATLNATFDSNFQDGGTGSITVGVPEPTTLGVLALGGLFLARRRRNA